MKTFVKKNRQWIVLAASAATMGISMPACPGTQALQQQVDQLNTTNADLTRKVQALDSGFKQLNQEMGQAKQILAEVNNTIKLQKAQLDQVDASVKALAAAKAAPVRTRQTTLPFRRKGR